MKTWLKSFALRRLDRILTHRGYIGADLELARQSVRDWVRARKHAGAHGALGGLQVIISAPGRAELLPIEVPLAARGSITVEVLVSAISPGTERAQWLRRPFARPALPFRPGYSGAGRVLAVGDGVGGFAEGDLVAIPRLPHVSVASVPAKWAIHIPDQVELADAAMVYLAMISGFGLRQGQPVAGRSVCVLGAGPIGILAGRLALQAGARRVTFVARSERHQARATTGGASFELASSDLGGLAADLVIEATGDPGAIQTAVHAVREGGCIVLLGSPRGLSPVPLEAIQRRGLQLRGAHISALSGVARSTGTDPFREIGTSFLSALRDGSLQVSDLVGAAFDPRDIMPLYRSLGSGELDSAHLDWTRIPASDRVQRRKTLTSPRLAETTRRIAAPEVRAAPPPGRKIRFALIGCGDIGFSNARAVARSGNAELAAVFDPVAELATAASVRFGGEIVSSFEEALNSELADAVLLSVPHDLHMPMICQAAAAGLHIVVEKPLAVDLPSALEAAKAIAAAGVTLSVCFPYRYEAASLAALDLVKAGAIGPVKGAALTFHVDKPQAYWEGGFSGRSTSNWRSSASRAGGGVLIMNMTHFIDMLRQLAGQEIISVQAFTQRAAVAEVEDSIAVAARFENGAIATLLGSASTRGSPDPRLELWGEHGTLELGSHPRIYSERAIPGLLTGRWNQLPVGESDERRLFVEQFCASLLDGVPPQVTLKDGLAVQAVVDAIYRSAASGVPERVWRPEDRQ